MSDIEVLNEVVGLLEKRRLRYWLGRGRFQYFMAKHVFRQHHSDIDLHIFREDEPALREFVRTELKPRGYMPTDETSPHKISLTKRGTAVEFPFLDRDPQGPEVRYHTTVYPKHKTFPCPADIFKDRTIEIDCVRVRVPEDDYLPRVFGPDWRNCEKGTGGIEVAIVAKEPCRKRNEALQLVKQFESTSIKIEDQLRHLLVTNRQQRDVAMVWGELLPVLQDKQLTNNEWGTLIGSYGALNTEADKLGRNLVQGVSFGVTAEGNTSTSSRLLWSLNSKPDLPSNVALAITSANGKLHQFVDLKAKVDSILSEFTRLSLAESKADAKNKSPKQHLVDAIAAIEAPSGNEPAPVAVLISLRSCIQVTVERLFQRRPSKPTVKLKGNKWKAKVCSIGEQCAVQNLGPGHFIRRGEDIRALLDGLSPAKTKEMPPPQLVALFERGLLALSALLKSIDETRLLAD